MKTRSWWPLLAATLSLAVPGSAQAAEQFQFHHLYLNPLELDALALERTCPLTPEGDWWLGEYTLQTVGGQRVVQNRRGRRVLTREVAIGGMGGQSEETCGESEERACRTLADDCGPGVGERWPISQMRGTDTLHIMVAGGRIPKRIRRLELVLTYRSRDNQIRGTVRRRLTLDRHSKTVRCFVRVEGYERDLSDVPLEWTQWGYDGCGMEIQPAGYFQRHDWAVADLRSEKPAIWRYFKPGSAGVYEGRGSDGSVRARFRIIKAHPNGCYLELSCIS